MICVTYTQVTDQVGLLHLALIAQRAQPAI